MMITRIFKLISFALLLFSLGIPSVQASFIDGCYETREINGQEVVPGPSAYNSQSKIYSLNNEFYYDLETKKSLNTKIFSIFTGFEDVWYSFTNGLVFEDLGSLSITENSFNYQFEDYVLHRNSYYALEKVDFKTIVSFQLIDSNIVGHIKQFSKALKRDMDIQVVLKKITCIE